MRILFSFIALFCISFSFAQKATISGVLTDLDMNNEVLPFANVMVKGTTIGTTTNENGEFSVSVEAGTHTIVFSFLGYKTETETITVEKGKNYTITKALGSESVMLEDVVLTATVNREKESALLMEQKGAVEIKQSIGAQEMSRKGVSDVSGAVAKTSGVTKQEGSGNIFVRGLGDRYNSTSMNGLPIPSNDPEKKNITLDIFSTDIVESVSIDKIYSSKIYGDFGGGNIDIISKEYNGDGLLSLGMQSAVNTNAVSNSNFRLQKGYSFVGFSNSPVPNNPLSGYNFQNSLNPDYRTPWGGGGNLTGGKRFRFGSESQISVFGTVSFDNRYTSITDGFAKAVNNIGTPTKDFHSYENFNYTTNTTGLFNLAYRINSNHKLKYSTVFINSSDQTLKEYNGNIVDVTNEGGFIRRSDYNKNSVFINQLLGEHKYNQLGLNWGISYNQVNGDMPDRTTITLKRNTDNQFIIANNSASDNQRYYQKLVEDEYAANIAADYKFQKSDIGYKGKVTVGFNTKLKQRDFQATQFNFKINANTPDATSTVVDPNNIDAYFNSNNFASNYFKIVTYNGGASNPEAALRPQTYNGLQLVSGAFTSVEYKFSELFVLVAGLRSEQVYQRVNWETQLSPEGGRNKLLKDALLPNITGKLKLTEDQNFRFGLSKTYTLPQFKERALFIYEDITEAKFGNPYLYASDNYNADLKWELFPKSDEVIAVSGFYKYIINPINEITIASSSNDISYANTGDWGYVYGLELEAKKNILDITNDVTSEKISCGGNLSLMKSNQELNDTKVRAETEGLINTNFNTNRSEFSGASNVLFNADVTYSLDWKESGRNIMATIAGNTYSDKLYAIGNLGRGNIVEKSLWMLDFIVKSKLNKKMGLGLSAKNLLNPTFRRVQENNNNDITILSFKKGMNISLSLNYLF